MVEFAHPGFLWALPAAALPVLIHLLNRRRYRRVPWAAMAHLLTAERRSRRRVRMQNAIVLALRTAAVALVVLLFARPALARRLPGLTPTSGSRFVLLLDDSASMGRVHEGTSAFERAAEFASAMAPALADAGAGLTAFAASKSGPFFQAALMGPDDVTAFRARLADLAPAAAAFDPGARLAALGKAAAGTTTPRFIIVTDLQASNWGTDGLFPAAADALRALQGHGPVQIVDVGLPAEAGVGLADLLDGGRPAYARTTSVFQAVIENDSSAARAALPVEVNVDGRGVPPAAGPALPGGERREAAIDVYVEKPGFHWIEAAVEGGDDFPADDRRCLAFEAVDALPVLVVEGGSAVEPADASGFYLKAALQPTAGASPGLRVTARRAEVGPPDDLGRYAAVFLCGVRTPAAWGEALQRYVSEGGRLIVFLDDAADPDAYARTLLGEGGLLPCRPGELVRPATGQAFGLTAFEFSDPLLQPFAEWGALFGMVRFRTFRAVAPLGSTRVLARFNDAGASPALMSAGAGRGEVVLLPCTANDAWTDWPRSEAGRVTYVPLMHWLAEQGATGPRRRGYRLNLPAGAPLEFPLDSARFRTDALLRPPADASGAGTEAAHLQARPRADRDGLWLVSEPLTRAGAYELQLSDVSGERRSVYFAVHLPERERLPARIAREDVAAAAGGRLRVVGYEGTAASGLAGEAPSVSAWPYLAAGLLALLLVESLLAWRFGNPRARAKRAAGRQGGSP